MGWVHRISASSGGHPQAKRRCLCCRNRVLTAVGWAVWSAAPLRDLEEQEEPLGCAVACPAAHSSLSNRSRVNVSLATLSSGRAARSVTSAAQQVLEIELQKPETRAGSSVKQ